MSLQRAAAAFDFIAYEMHQCRIDHSNRIELHDGLVPHVAWFCHCGQQVHNAKAVSRQQIADNRWNPIVVEHAWHRLTAANGSVSWIWQCRACRFGQAVKHAMVPFEIINGTPHQDYTVQDNVDRSRPCERCGSTGGVEFHHYAPVSLFDDAHRWATGYLCRACHTEWHRKTSTGAFASRRSA